MPLPGRLAIRTEPRTDCTMLWTTSRPTPRPEISVTCSLVEKPGRKRNSSSSASPSRWATAALVSPRSTTLVRRRSRSMPRPSSLRVIWSIPARWWASSGWPPERACRARRSSGDSIPWSIALRIRWLRGASSRSRMSRSTPVVSPATSNRACLPMSRARSRTSRGKPRMPSASGRIRLASTSW